MLDPNTHSQLNWEILDSSHVKISSKAKLALNSLESILKITRGYPDEFSLTVRGSNLTDLELLALSLLTLKYEENEERALYLQWELRLFLLKYTKNTQNILGTLVLTSSSQSEAVARLVQINPKRYEAFLQRNFKSNLETALSKLVVRFPSGRVINPQRKRGYNDHGSLAPYDKKARIDARDYSEDLRLTEDKLLQELLFTSNLGVLTGWSQ